MQRYFNAREASFAVVVRRGTRVPFSRLAEDRHREIIGKIYSGTSDGLIVKHVEGKGKGVFTT